MSSLHASAFVFLLISLMYHNYVFCVGQLFLNYKTNYHHYLQLFFPFSLILFCAATKIFCLFSPSLPWLPYWQSWDTEENYPPAISSIILSLHRTLQTLLALTHYQNVFKWSYYQCSSWLTPPLVTVPPSIFFFPTLTTFTKSKLVHKGPLKVH